MVTGHMNNIIKIAVNHKKKHQHTSSAAEKSRRKMCFNHNDNSDTGNRTIKNNVFKNINSAMFAMLLQRTTFAMLMASFLLSSVQLVNGDEFSTSPMPKDFKENITYAYPINMNENSPRKPEDSSAPTPVYIPFGASFFEGPKFKNGTLKTGNTLWDGLLNECSAKPSISCIQKNVYSYLDDNLGFGGDVNVTEGFRFRKNKLAHWKYTEQANARQEDRENEVEDDEPRHSASPIEEVTDSLYDKGVGFMMTHDLELQLPEMMFNGAVLKISPRALEGSGALVHLDLQSKNEVNTNGEGRIFFKKIKKFIKNKILLGILAIIVVIKLIKLKLFVFMPLIMGVHNAKKLFLKLLLFVFPALSHIFKLCSWYHENYHHTKYHHHHHQISHIHHPTHGGYGYPSSHHGDFHGDASAVQYHVDAPSSPWDYSSPGLGPEFIGADIHRNSFNPRPEDMNDIKSWGLGSVDTTSHSTAQGNTAFTKPYSTYYDDQRYVRATANVNPRIKQTTVQGPTTIHGPTPYRGPNQVNPQVEKEALIRAAALRQEQLRQEQLRAAQAQAQQILRQQEEQKLALQNQLAHSQDNGSPVYDAFYTPILQKVDKVFELLGFHNEPCRERLICLMYKDPASYSPHSNLISNELSRDANELQKPAPGSTAALRFFKYVQAARDGQDRKDCVQLYPHCAINGEKKSLN